MMAKTPELLQPQYAAGFHCIGPECEDDCCHGWQVTIDKQTYRKYRSCPDLDLRARLEKFVARNRSNPSDDIYAKIKLRDGVCPIMDSDRLCTLQRTMGEDYLSITCDTYPRNFREINGTLEMALTLSCPEAARRILLTPKPMEFEYAANLHSRTNQVHLPFNSDDPRYKNKAERHFWPLRVFIISLMQNRNYPIWQRLVILGFFCQTLQNTETSSEIPAVIERYNRMVEQGIFKEELEAIPASYEIQVGLLRQLVMLRMTGGDISPQFFDCLDKAKQLIGLEETVDPEISTNNFKAAYETYYHPFMTEHEFTMENFLVNYIFKNAFPFGGNKLFEEYVQLVVHYAMVKMMLIGLAGFHKESFGLDHVVQVIYSFSRTVEHHHTFLGQVQKIFKENKLDTLAYMAILIRN